MLHSRHSAATHPAVRFGRGGDGILANIFEAVYQYPLARSRMAGASARRSYYRAPAQHQGHDVILKLWVNQGHERTGDRVCKQHFISWCARLSSWWRPARRMWWGDNMITLKDLNHSRHYKARKLRAIARIKKRKGKRRNAKRWHYGRLRLLRTAKAGHDTHWRALESVLFWWVFLRLASTNAQSVSAADFRR